MDEYVPEEFYDFVEPKGVFDYTRPTNDPIKNANFILRKKKLIEASAAARLAIGLNLIGNVKVFIRLIKQQSDHDFELRIGQDVQRFQFTECLEENRKRDFEYKEQSKGIVQWRPYRPALNKEKAIPWILDAIDKKKNYSDRPHLLIYVNFNSYELQFDQLTQAVQQLDYLNRFSSVWAFLTSSPDVSETSLGRLHPNPHGWWTYDCSKERFVE